MSQDGDYRVGSPILTSDYPEGLHLNPKGKSGIQPSYLLFRNIDELKQMCVPDQLAVMNNGGDLNWGLKAGRKSPGNIRSSSLARWKGRISAMRFSSTYMGIPGLLSLIGIY